MHWTEKQLFVKLRVDTKLNVSVQMSSKTPIDQIENKINSSAPLQLKHQTSIIRNTKRGPNKAYGHKLKYAKLEV
jgi:hypothetical protein